MIGITRLYFTCPWSMTYLFSCNKRTILSLVLTSERSDTWVLLCQAFLGYREDAGCPQHKCRKSLQSCPGLGVSVFAYQHERVWMWEVTSCVIREWESMVALLRDWMLIRFDKSHRWKKKWLQSWNKATRLASTLRHLACSCWQHANECAKWGAPFFVSELIFERHLMAGMDEYGTIHPSGLQQYSYKSVEMWSAVQEQVPWERSGFGFSISFFTVLWYCLTSEE